jgi:molybdopterin molybdotransferase
VTLLRLEEARDRILAGAMPLPAESVPLTDALGRVLAEPLEARFTLPPWDNSAMDGFAVRAQDVAAASAATPVVLRVVGEVAAGHPPAAMVGAGTAVRVLTGAMLAPGADSVVPVEETDAAQGVAALPDQVAVRWAAPAGANIRAAGSDLRAGDRLLEAGVCLRPQALAVIAAGGYGHVPVHRRPRVAVMATGDELVPAGEPLGPAQIPDSNTVSLAAQVRDAGGEVIAVATVRDDPALVLQALGEAAGRADVVVASGGVSVGAHDLVRDALAELGSLALWRVAIQPGKPLAFATAVRPDGGSVRLFGLPGNPVSSFVTLELFVRPLLRCLGGRAGTTGRPVITARLEEPVQSPAGRRSFLRVQLRADELHPGTWLARLAGGQGSHVLSALAQADGLAIVPEEVEAMPAGAEVQVLRLDGDGDA